MADLVEVVGGPLYGMAECVSIGNSIFRNNKGSAIYILDTCFYIFDNMLFEENYGGAIHVSMRNSNVEFRENSNVIFSNNVAASFFGGGAIFVSHSRVLFKKSATVVFYNNKASNGGALYLQGNAHIIFEEKSFVKCTGNSASKDGGAIFLYTGNATFDNCMVIFDGNTANTQRGGVYLHMIVVKLHSQVIPLLNSLIIVLCLEVEYTLKTILTS